MNQLKSKLVKLRKYCSTCGEIFSFLTNDPKRFLGRDLECNKCFGDKWEI